MIVAAAQPFVQKNPKPARNRSRSVRQYHPAIIPHTGRCLVAHSKPTVADRLISFLWRRPAANIGERTRRRVVVHLIPFLFFLYVLAYIDRSNVAVAQLDMREPVSEGGLGFDQSTIGFGIGIFFWGYWILEIPSTVSVLRWGARYVFVRILVLWGLACTLLGTIGTPLADSLFGWLPAFHDDPSVRQFYFLRFLLGFFEGGFYPSVILYLSLWFRPRDRARALAAFMAAGPLALAVGAPLSGLIREIHWFDLPGWRWIFFLQGVVPILAGVATLFFFPNRPQDAAWLSPEERDWLVGELQHETEARKKHGMGAWINQAGVVLLLTAYYFCTNTTGYGLSSFMPAIIEAQTKLPKIWCTVLAGLVYLMALLGVLFNGWHSDRSGERIGHTVVPLTCLSLGILLAAWTDGHGWWPVLILLFCVGPFAMAQLPAFWPIPSMFLGSAAAASAIGFINMIGNLGGSLGPTMVGKAAEGQTTFAPALYRLAPFPLIAVCIILLVGWLRRHTFAAHRQQTSATGS